MCSLAEAYEPFSDPPVVAEKKYKKRKRYALPPSEVPDQVATVDPDRPANRLRPGELLQGSDEPSVSQILNAATPSQSYFPHPTPEVDDASVYNLDPQWAKMFTETTAPAWIKDRMPDRQSEVPLIPSAWVDGQSTLWKNVNPGSELDVRGAQTLADSRVEALQKKLDAMFARLDDMESQKRNGTNLELLMFVFGGFFLLLVLDLLVKQGMTATIALANASNVVMKNARGIRPLLAGASLGPL
jgi:hypothetical protein